MKSPLNVIIVEDSEDDARLMARELEQADYQVALVRVETAAELQGALVGPPCDVVLCDFTLPHLSGLVALEMVQARSRDLSFIYVSGTMGEDVAVEALKAGAHDYVVKSNLARLGPAVTRELRAAAERRELRRVEAERQRLLAELQASLAVVKRLSGLLPICPQCRRIRDDQGYWQQVEKYIEEHSAARFSHTGLCPECHARVFEHASDHDALRD